MCATFADLGNMWINAARAPAAQAKSVADAPAPAVTSQCLPPASKEPEAETAPVPCRDCECVFPSVVAEISQPLVGGLFITKERQEDSVSAQALAPVTPEQRTNFRQTLLQCLNEARAANGVSRPLVLSAQLNRGVAQPWTDHMATTLVLQHNPNLAKEVSAQGIAWKAIGENIGWISGVTGARAAARQLCSLWLASPGHRANILNPSFSLIGIGYSRSATTTHWSTNDFVAV